MLKEYRGEPRRYYKLNASPEDKEALVKESCTILFPEFRTEEPKVLEMVIERYGDTSLRKIEIFDGCAWVRTILV